MTTDELNKFLVGVPSNMRPVVIKLINLIEVKISNPFSNKEKGNSDKKKAEVKTYSNKE